MSASIEVFFHADTGTLSYVVADPATRSAAVIDPVLDYDPAAGKVGTASADAIAGYLSARGLRLEWLLETHVHADHLSGASYLKSLLGGRIAMGAGVRQVIAYWAPVFGAPELIRGEDCFDRLLEDGERLGLGELAIEVLATPGHTDSCVSYRIGDAVFVGDTLFQPDVGTARCDFPGGDAELQYRSLSRLLALGEGVRFYTGHDYPSGGRGPAWESGAAEQQANNAMLKNAADADAYAAARRARDAKLPVPRLLLPSLQVNLRAGRLPEPEGNGRRYLKIPLCGYGE